MPKFGEFNSARLKPTWESQTKPGNDKTGWKRGQCGFAEWQDDESEFMRDGNPAASDMMYGRRGDRPNGQQVVMTKSRDPGNLVDHGKGAKGIDADDGDHFDDGVRR